MSIFSSDFQAKNLYLPNFKSFPSRHGQEGRMDVVHVGQE